MNRTGPLAAALLPLVLGCVDARATGEPAAELLIGHIAPPSQAAGARRGAELGAEEAARAGQLIGRSFGVLMAEAEGPRATTRAARRLHRQGAFAIVGGFDEPTCRALSELAEGEGFLFINVGCRDEELRDPRLGNTFHIEASDTAYERAGGGLLWHPGLRRYGAAQLNERFLSRFGAGPDPAAWASWMAVKVLAEASLESGETDAPVLVDRLESPGTRFDGHKGEPLRFDSVHQLLQPLYPRPEAADGRAGPSGGADPRAQGGGAVASGRRPERVLRLPPGVDRGRLGFVSNEGSGDITVFHTGTLEVYGSIPVGARPRGIHVSPDGGRVYVALSDDAPRAESDEDAIAVIDLDSMAVVARYPVGTDPEQFAVSPDGRTLYASNEDAGTAAITDLRTGRLLGTLVVGVEPEGVAASPDGRWVYVTAETSNTVSVIDTRSGEVVSNLLVDVRPRAATFAPDGRRAYVTNEISGTISVIDVESHRVVGTVELDDPRAKPVGVVVSPDGTRVYVASGHGHSVFVIDAATLAVTARVPVGQRPWGVALNADGSRLFTANGGSHDVSVIDTRTLEVVGTIPVGVRPWGVAVPR